RPSLTACWLWFCWFSPRALPVCWKRNGGGDGGEGVPILGPGEGCSVPRLSGVFGSPTPSPPRPPCAGAVFHIFLDDYRHRLEHCRRFRRASVIWICCVLRS